MSILTWVVLGLIAGWLASLIMGNREGILTDVVLGVVGAVIGGFVMSLFGNDGVNGFNIYSIAVATLGAVVLIWLGRLFRPRTY